MCLIVPGKSSNTVSIFALSIIEFNGYSAEAFSLTKQKVCEILLKSFPSLRNRLFAWPRTKLAILHFAFCGERARIENSGLSQVSLSLLLVTFNRMKGSQIAAFVRPKKRRQIERISMRVEHQSGEWERLALPINYNRDIVSQRRKSRPQWQDLPITIKACLLCISLLHSTRKCILYTRIGLYL